MTGYYNRQDQDIVFIKSLEDLDKDAEHRDYDAQFIFANFKVVDKTCNKVLKFFVSSTKAEARKQRQLAYKKHANCEVVIEELHLLDNVEMYVRDISGTEQHRLKIRNLLDEQRDIGKRIQRFEMMSFSKNINLNGTVKSILTDKYINTKNGQMRMMIIELSDKFGETIEVTLWGDMTEGIVKDCSIELRKAEINTYEYARFGLQVPRYGSVKITYTPEPEKPVELPKDGLIMELNFKSGKDLTWFMQSVNPKIREEDSVYVDYVNGVIKIRNPTRYERLGMKITEFGSVPNEPRSKRIEKLEGVEKDNFVTVGVLNDGPYGQKHTPIVENFSYQVVKGDEDKHLSYMDKYSYKCGQCDEKYGYQSEAEACSKNHIPFGKMIGDVVKSVNIKHDN